MPNTHQKAAIQHFPAMIKAARQLGCQLLPEPNNQTILRGLCPFHESYNLATAKTLQVNTKTTKFWCQVCEHTGNPITFMAKVWGVSIQDAQTLLRTTPQPGATKPRYPKSHFQKNSPQNEGGIPQNTALLTRATRFYVSNLQTSYPAVHLLARLDVDPEHAAKAGIGFCTGTGLREYLKHNEISDPEIEHSPLFDHQTGFERMVHRITFSDKDASGATIWMTSLSPTAETKDLEFNNKTPRTFGIPGRKPYLFNLHNAKIAHNHTVITDDPRLFIVLAARQQSALLWTHRRRNDEKVFQTSRRAAEIIYRRNPGRLTIAVHDRLRATTLYQAFESLNPEMPVKVIRRRGIQNFIDLQTRDWADIYPNPDPCPATETTDGHEEPPETFIPEAPLTPST